MISFPGFILIDDKDDELKEIHDSFIDAGFPCLPIQYKSEPDNQSGIDHANIESIIPRVVITDLNLEEQNMEASGLVGPVANVLKRLHIKGPYLLYFWSRNESKVAQVMDLLKSREKFSDIPLPLSHGIISKTELQGKSADLQKKIKGLISESPTFNALLDWENRVAKAARETTNSLYDITTPSTRENYQEEHSTKLNDILALIGNETFGKKNAKAEPEQAIDLGLAPVLYDRLNFLSEKQNRSVWLKAAPNIGDVIISDSRAKAQLNSFYHLEEISLDSLKEKRGTWIECNTHYFESNKAKIKSNLGKDIKTIIHEEFLDSNQGTKSERQKARDDLRIGFIELSAECDQAQKKTKLHKYLLSALIPVEHRDFTYFRDSTNDTAHSGIYRLPNLIINSMEYIVKVTFMYQVGAIPDVNKWLGEPVFRLKNQILSDISYQCSMHASRPGIIRFD